MQGTRRGERRVTLVIDRISRRREGEMKEAVSRGPDRDMTINNELN
jgi:hypothetical protein